ncbi:MAG TPA: hypothetical protein VG367_14330 [Mucilaginibacter sp.]|jgi:hypothetical protein|nr:hypothetical protein [Mucilaginibacter sp.]
MAGIKKYKILITAMLLLGLTSSFSDGYAQVLPGLQKDFATYQQNNLQEKIFAHVNKSFYEAGEILWFKIYCVDAANNKPLELSKVAYVELIDENHAPVVQTMVALKDGSGSGSVYLPFSLSSGHHVFRAYTSWMKNFDPGYFFESQVTIFNPRKPMTDAKPATVGYDVQFFPEGGHLVQGINSKVAFKVAAGDGKGTACDGFVVSSKGDTAVKFSTLKFGIGSFMFTPKANENYKAVLKVNSQVVTKELPQVYTSGFTLQVTDGGDKWNVHIQGSGADVAMPVYLILHNNYAIKQADEIHPDQQGAADVAINKSKPDEGISYITLFDAKRQPVCERMIFKRPSGKLLIVAKTDQSVSDIRRKVDLTLSAKNEQNSNAAAELSISVFRADGLQNTSPDHINGYMWLRAALKGYMESPDYYLENTDKEADAALDNLLLSQGWTQFDWSKISAGNPSKRKFLPEYIGPVITGRITNITNNKPAPGITTYLTINGNPQQLYVAKSDSSGKLLFNTQNFYGQHEIVAQANGTVDSTYRVDIQSPYADAAGGGKTEADLNQEIKKALVESSVNMQVQNIFSGDQIKQFYSPATDSTSFFGKPGKSYKLDDYTRFTTMEEVLREYVVSIGVAKHQGKFVIHMFDGDRLLGDPLVLLDGVPVFDADKLFKWDPLKIKKLDVVSHDYLYGPVMFNGVMNFTTYKGDGTNMEIDPHAVVLDYEGLQLERKFYSPVYESAAERNSTIPDFRTALYWNPDVNTNSAGKANLSFYTSDKPGQYIGVIEGITADGQSGSGIFTFEVKK